VAVCREVTFGDSEIKSMHKPARYGVALLRTIPFLVGSGLTIMFLLLASCDEAERHEVLTFFFDGVPPLHGETSAAVPTARKEEKTAGSPAAGWTVHEPVKDCTQCHGEQRGKGFAGKVRLMAEVPQLCYRCHKEFSTLESWVHGPVATGDCLLCHEPHKTKTEFLLRKPVPQLCYQCHDVQAIRTIAKHAEEAYSRCIDCHEGHAGATKGLLRAAFLEQPAGLEYQSEIHRRKYEASLRKARSGLTQGQDFLTFCRTILDFLDGGQLWPARAYLEVLLGSNLVLETEKPGITELLRQITALHARGPAGDPNSPEGQALSDIAQRAAAALRAIREQRSAQDRDMAETYYRSIKQFHAGQFTEARDGFRQVLGASSLPRPMKDTAQTYLERIEQTLKQSQQPGWQVLK